MAARRKPQAREAHLAFEALAIEGGLLSPEWLSKILPNLAVDPPESTGADPVTEAE